MWDPAGRAEPAVLGRHGAQVRALAALADGRLASGTLGRLHPGPARAIVESRGVVIVGDGSGRVHYFDIVEASSPIDKN